MTLATELCETIVAVINLMDLPSPANAVRYYQPKFLLSDLSAMKVCVVPTAVETQDLSRGSLMQLTTIQIGVMKLCDKSLGQLDALSEIVEQIAEELRNFEFAFPEASFVTYSQIILLYDAEHLNAKGQFTSVIELEVKTLL